MSLLWLRMTIRNKSKRNQIFSGRRIDVPRIILGAFEWTAICLERDWLVPEKNFFPPEIETGQENYCMHIIF